MLLLLKLTLMMMMMMMMMMIMMGKDAILDTLPYFRCVRACFCVFMESHVCCLILLFLRSGDYCDVCVI